MPNDHHHIAIIGAGFAGIGLAIQLRRDGVDDFVIFERAPSIGGVWRDNAYPGCQCDVPTHLYSFSFAPNPDWSRVYGSQAEIWRYMEDCADRFDVRRFIRFETPVEGASWDDDRCVWLIRTPEGTCTSDVLVAGVGALSEPSVPDLPGLETFAGPVFHSARWRHDVDLSGLRVASIGTGASAIQFVPEIQPAVARLDVYQRTPPWVVPRNDRPISEAQRGRYRRHPALQRASRVWQYWSHEVRVIGFTRVIALQRILRLLALRHLKSQVPDPGLRARLTPSYEIGCKRILLSDTWYPALQQPNVDLITDAIVEIRPDAIVTAAGDVREVDAIVFGTGFLVTAHPGFDAIVGRDGRSLGDVWRSGGMTAYRGTTVAGFPNLFIMTGPNTGLGHSSMIFMMEAQFAYVRDALRTMQAEGIAALDPTPESQVSFDAGVQRRLQGTVWNAGGCVSWYLDAHGRNPTLWPGSTWSFRRSLRRFDVEAYRRTPHRAGPAARDAAVRRVPETVEHPN